MATLVKIRGLDRSIATGYSVRRGFRIKDSSANLVEVTASSNVEVDLDDANTRKTLARYAGRFIVIPAGTGSLVYIRSIEGSEATGSIVSRGFRITGSDTNQHNVLPDGVAVRVDVSDSKVRRTLAQHRDKWIEANTSDKLVTIRAIQTSEASVGGGISARGFRIKNASGVPKDVSAVNDVQVDLGDPYTRRVLRRNVNRYVVVSSP